MSIIVYPSRSVLIAVLLVVLITPPCLAQTTASDTFRDACRAELLGEHALAFILYEQTAERGIREAAFALGRFHRDGLGTSPDPYEALSWFLKAAEQGHHIAQYEVGIAYRNGLGTAQDLTLAREWLGAASLTHGPAAFAVFEMEDDPDERRLWLQLAANLGDVRAMRKLAEGYDAGTLGLPVSAEKSQKWRQRADATEAGEDRP